jgi:hypothetical protein
MRGKMTGGQDELERRMTVILQRLRATPHVQTHLASLDRAAAAAWLAELTVRELKADPGTLDLMRQARARK